MLNNWITRFAHAADAREGYPDSPECERCLSLMRARTGNEPHVPWGEHLNAWPVPAMQRFMEVLLAGYWRFPALGYTPEVEAADG